MHDQPSTGDSNSEALENLLARALDLREDGDTRGFESLLRDHPDEAPAIRDALAELARADLLNNADHAQPDEPGMPRRFDDFELLDQLGAGGMGVVYRARQHSLAREVAVKVIRPELLLFEGARERFRREIDAVARLDHPAIVPVYATGSVQGVPYYVMPNLRGGSAQDAILALQGVERPTGADLCAALGRSPDAATGGDDPFDGGYWQAVVRLIRKAALGVQHAHIRGVLHRDLKPSNIFFTSSGAAVVLDFGLARAGEDPKLTRTGSTAGSPAYMAPEQVRGDPADERTDVYGLAATLHSLLARRPPFATDTEEALRSRILAGDRDDLRQYEDVPTELEVVIASAMDRDRAHRYASCEEFADDLERVLDGRPIQARSLPLGVRARRFVQRHRAWTAASCVAAAFLVLLPLLLYWQQLAASETLQQQVRETNSVNTRLEQANEQLASTNGELKNANQLLNELNQALKVQIERSDKSFNVSIAAVSRLLSSTSARQLDRKRAPQELVIGLLQDAYDLFGELVYDEKFQAKVDEMRLFTLESLVDVYATMGKLKEAEEVADKIRAQLGDGELPLKLERFRAAALRSKASIRMELRRHDGVPALLEGARSGYERVLEVPALREKALAQIASLDNMIAGLAMRSGKMDDAEAALRRGIETTRALVSDPQFVSAHGLNLVNLVRFLKANRRYEEALVEVEAQLAGLAELPANSDNFRWPTPRYVRAMGQCERFRLLQLKKDAARALPAAEEALKSLDELIAAFPGVPELPRLRGTVYGNLALLHGSEGDWDLAIPLARSSVADERDALRMSPDDPQARRFLLQHQLQLCRALRYGRRYGALAAEALQLGRAKIPAPWRVQLARDLLLVLTEEPPSSPDELREQAVQWLLQANEEGTRIDMSSTLFDAVRADPRLSGLKK